MSLVRRFIAAVAFLTRVPVGRWLTFDGRAVGGGAPFFPLVGALVGGLAGLGAHLVSSTLPPIAVGALAVGLSALITGAMHLDALADTADALGGTTRERSLEIMRDHAIGAFGATALVTVCLVDAGLVGALAPSWRGVYAFAVAGAIGRAAMLPLGWALPYARAGGGLGRVLDGVGVIGIAVGLLTAVAIAALLGLAGLAGVAAGGGVAAVLGLYFHRWLGGVTGDTLGATAKLAETAALIAIVMVGL